MAASYHSTTRPPSFPLSPPRSPSPPNAFPRPSAQTRRPRSTSFSHAPLLQRLVQTGLRLAQQSLRAFQKLSLFQQSILVAAGVFSAIFGILFLVYNERIFTWLVPVAEKWRALPGGWLILFGIIVLTAFPPMIGYSTSVTTAGFLYGFPGGWPVAAGANLVGSLLALLLFRTLLKSLAARLAAADARFAAFERVLARDGFRILAMIRLCPLPYSLSNAALATFPAVRPGPFVAATALATPKLLIHVFIGSRLAELAASGEKGLDFGAKLANWLGIGIGVTIGVLTGWVIYRRMMARTRELEGKEWDKVDQEDSALQHLDEFEEGDEEEGTVRPERRASGDDEIDFLDEDEGSGYYDEPGRNGESGPKGIGLERQRPMR